jgi:5-methylthioadenosine/S-adenosylhomocysteine deaminase
VILLDLTKPKFAPRTNVPALVANTATGDDVETVLVDGELLMHEGEVSTMDGEAVQARAEAAVDRFAAESGWSVGPGGADPPGALRTAADLPKRGPTRLFARLARQRIEDALGR